MKKVICFMLSFCIMFALLPNLLPMTAVSAADPYCDLPKNKMKIVDYDIGVDANTKLKKDPVVWLDNIAGSASFFAAGEREYPYFTIDFKQPTTLHGFRVLPRLDTNPIRLDNITNGPAEMKIETSDDGVNFTTAHSSVIIRYPKPYSEYAPEIPSQITYMDDAAPYDPLREAYAELSSDVTARYVRFTILKEITNPTGGSGKYTTMIEFTPVGIPSSYRLLSSSAMSARSDVESADEENDSNIVGDDYTTSWVAPGNSGASTITVNLGSDSFETAPASKKFNAIHIGPAVNAGDATLSNPPKKVRIAYSNNSTNGADGNWYDIVTGDTVFSEIDLTYVSGSYNYYITSLTEAGARYANTKLPSEPASNAPWVAVLDKVITLPAIRTAKYVKFEFATTEQIKVANVAFEEVDDIKPTSISFEPNTYNLKLTDTVIATPKLMPEGASGEITYSSSNSNVATVEVTGKITAKAGGTATITAAVAGQSGNLTGTITVNVAEPSGISFSMNPNSAVMKLSQTIQLTPIFTPTGQQAYVDYSSDSPEIAFVDSDGLITALGIGSATITGVVRGRENVKNTVTVTIHADSAAEIIGLPENTIILTKGMRYELHPSVLPATAPQEVTYASNAQSVALIDSMGVITPVEGIDGTAVITVTTIGASPVSKTVNVKVINAGDLNKGKMSFDSNGVNGVNTPGRAIDNNKGSYFSASGSNNTSWLTLNLGSTIFGTPSQDTYAIAGIKYMAPNVATHKVRGYEIWISEDSANGKEENGIWTKVSEGEFLDTTAEQTVMFDNLYNAKYLKMKILNKVGNPNEFGKYAMIAQLTVVGRVEAAGRETAVYPAKNIKVTASSASGVYSARNILDGDIDTAWRSLNGSERHSVIFTLGNEAEVYTLRLLPSIYNNAPTNPFGNAKVSYATEYAPDMWITVWDATGTIPDTSGGSMIGSPNGYKWEFPNAANRYSEDVRDYEKSIDFDLGTYAKYIKVESNTAGAHQVWLAEAYIECNPETIKPAGITEVNFGANNKITSVSIRNYSELTGKLIVAVYDGMELAGVHIQDIVALPAGMGGTHTVTLTGSNLPEALDGNKVKAFIWNTISELKPADYGIYEATK
ncbi:MAG: discoidin domain-containing protein [Firmicutes bacterium]|nr:discoidin domain-containing protein [Bacillota bacterium]